MRNTEPGTEFSSLVVGLGSIGLRHVENLRQLGCRRIGAYRFRNAPLHRAVDLDGVVIHDDYQEALDHGYDTVVICNPTSLHLGYAQRAADSGCHLYIEKPVSHTLENTGELLATVERNGLVTEVGCQFRFHPNLEAIKRWLREKAVGSLLSVHVDMGEYLPGWHPWEDYRSGYAAQERLGGGVVLTMIHDIDYLYWLFGPIHPLKAIGGRSGALDLDVEDHVTGVLVSDTGVPVTLHMDYLQRPPCRRIKIIGNRGVIGWDYYSGLARMVVDGELKEESRLPDDWNRNNLFLAITSDFLETVRSGGTPRVGLEDGIETLRIALELKAQLSNSFDERG